MQFLASIVGQIMSMSLALGPIARLRTRALYAVIDSRHSWSDQLELFDDAIGMSCCSGSQVSQD